MCGVSGALNLDWESIPSLNRRLHVMNQLQSHRGPDGEGIWTHQSQHIGFAHRRLSIIDLNAGSQPMTDQTGNWLTYNGEIYNYIELRQELDSKNFITNSDTEVILKAYRKWGTDCVNHFRGMFAFALWDESNQVLFCARDRFGIKPFYYTVVDRVLYFASEAKALLPFVKSIETDLDGFKDYLTFQFCLAGKTLFKGINELLPGHVLQVVNGVIKVKRYWEVYHNLDFDHTAKYFEEQIAALLSESVELHLRSDVPIGAYVSGGLDSSIIASLANQKTGDKFIGFTGKFSLSEDYDESKYARELAQWSGFELHELDITANDFIENIRKVIYHLDYPVAGPGSFPQYMISQLASKHRKVVLGGQGADEIFGGYVRYLIAYFEQCIKGAIDGTMHSSNFIVTYESIIPNLTALRKYKPMLKEFWREGLFEELNRRYFRLINRAPSLGNEINWEALGNYSPFETFQEIFLAENVGQESYFDSMTHFDFKTLLPALLQIEDRVSMAHGLESRVPFLDHPLIELAATIPANIKFKDGTMKQVLKNAMRTSLPASIWNRQDKMGFPVPLVEWMQGNLKNFVCDIFSANTSKRDLINNQLVLDSIGKENKFGRKIWGLLCLELWEQEFHDQALRFRKLV
ncbi:asparagine synthase (glutamine-hydrolyzing) [Nostoc sp. FACHB-190]|uniref:asparagine synthase (glutamine-hydrolyzing) n=1 Tax=Nostoc sp. FACHB-190 TaxID=2692838 RepID=UPI001684F27C|nr:asparagine synthase (glutamine-hydrolyzing) [Nostoc sp. FACHB-190]MBD2297081.1 asparagine synthase (glutamine-hydrolyzing) [Nostoc sp. FACHB-190]